MAAPRQTEDELLPSQTEGYKVGQEKTLAELNQLDKVVPIALFLESPTLQTPINLDLTLGPEGLKKHKKDPITIKEGADFSVGIKFRVENQIVSGMKYIQVVKRAGMTVDKDEVMIGSYGPQKDAHTKIFASEEAPSGMMARGTYNVRSRIVDDDGTIHMDFEWAFKIAKEW
ncbi:hypothetical protein QFC22_003779 [Naganishia vaughanmartiniae]|uniref:Uncharacterized protein n=1 Tax=Naganishia vaughanmartiniae TaxID=1424756 RepID=A0ACC2X5E8_9TREE|nr:hypothetical protein QFC22_003779 [Naganishia vaughanmartiniae]